MLYFFLVISILLSIVFPPVGIILLVGTIISMILKKESLSIHKENIIEKKRQDYYGKKMHNPIDQSTLDLVDYINKNKASTEPYIDHNKYLKSCIKDFEDLYTKKGHDDYFPEFDFEDMNRHLFTSPEKYISICKFLGVSFIKELVEDWKKNILLSQERTKRYEKLSNYAKNDEKIELDNIKTTILDLKIKGKSRSSIINFIKSKFQDDIVITRQNNIWYIKYKSVEERFQIIKDKIIEITDNKL